MRFVVTIRRAGIPLAVALALAGGAMADVVREAVEPILRLDLAGHTAEVRSLAFFPGGERLVSGGRDKVAMIWNPAGERIDAAGPRTRDIARRRTRERVLRWQVARGTRGAIQALAVSVDEQPLVALAGSGAMGSTGEVLLFDANAGTLEATLGGGDRVGHRNSVLAVAFAVGGGWIFSQDIDGQCFAWQRDAAWRPLELAAREERRYGADRAAAVRNRPLTRPLAAVAGGRVALPVLVSPAGAAIEVWRIELVDPTAPAARTVLAADHRGVVLAMAASADGRYLASTDLAGGVFVHDLAAGPPRVVSFAVAPAAESVAVTPDGGRVVLGVAGTATSRPRLEVWDAVAGRRLHERPTAAAVRAVTVSDDGRHVAWSGGWQHEVFHQPLEALAAAGGRPARLGGVGRRIARIAFERQADGQAAPGRIAIAWEPPPGAAAERAVGFEAAFDLEAIAPGDPPPAERLAPAEGRRGEWSLARAAAQRPGVETWSVTRGGEPVGRIDLDLGWQGRMGPAERCVSWLTRDRAAAEPWAVAVGTERGIFVHALPAAAAPPGPLPLVRRYRGNEDGVAALALSDDGRWLASGGRDGLVMLWPLAGLGGPPLFERFGVGLEVEAGRAVVTSLAEAGPLAGRGVVVGDVLARVSAPADGAAPAAEAEAGAAVVAALAAAAWPSQWAFVIERGGRREDPFNRQPAWENIAAFHLAADREWAYWSPRGYYAASANGDGRFGWLVNRGLDRPPRFHQARHFRRKLERPDVMAGLLAAGSLAEALRRTAAPPDDASALVLPRLIASAPEVRILSPEAFAAAEGAAVQVRATVELPPGAELAELRAFASGVVARGPATLVGEERTEDGPIRRTYRWDLDLPDESRHLIQVFAGTAAGPADVGETTVSHRQTAPPRRPPRLHLVSAGIDRYRNSGRFAAAGLTDLVFAAADATAVRDSLAARGRPFGGLTTGVLLRNDEVTRDAWRRRLESLVAEISADVIADDLVVVFLAGHGLTDATRGGAYAYLCHDVAFQEVGGEAVPLPATVLGWEDFRPLAALPCRKLALVDTCHAAALGPGRRAAVVRDFQEHMILVLAASADDEPSQEADAWGHGAFTKVLLEALAGAADTRGRTGAGGDGEVSVDELVEHVLAGVPALTAAGRLTQHATVSPDLLVPFVTLPLTRP